MKAMGTMFEKANRAKYFEFPSAVYSTWPYDKVTRNGKTIGISTWVGYSSNEGRMLTLAILDKEHAEMGSEVTFVWGEQPGTRFEANRRKPCTDGDPRYGFPGALFRSGAGSVSFHVDHDINHDANETQRKANPHHARR